MALSYWQQQARGKERVVDIAIVGGGVLGCATAFWLNELAPSQRVTLLEARQLGAGASGRSAGIVLPLLSADYQSDQRKHGAARARKLLQFVSESCHLLGEHCDASTANFRQSGGIVAADSEEAAEQLRQSISALRADGLPIAFLTPEAVNSRLVGQGYHGALYVPSAGMLNPLRLTRYLAASSEATVLEHHQAQGIRQTAGGTCIIETPRRCVRAQQIVVTIGDELTQLYPSLQRFLQPVMAQMLATEAAQEPWLRVPLYSQGGDFYMRQLGDGTVLAGSARHRQQGSGPHSSKSTTPAAQAELERQLHTHFPQTQALAIRHRWAETLSISPDHLPVLGELPNARGIWAIGGAGYSLNFAMGLGKQIAQHVIEGAETLELPLFSTSRFSQVASHH